VRLVRARKTGARPFVYLVPGTGAGVDADASADATVVADGSGAGTDAGAANDGTTKGPVAPDAQADDAEVDAASPADATALADATAPVDAAPDAADGGAGGLDGGSVFVDAAPLADGGWPTAPGFGVYRLGGSCDVMDDKFQVTTEPRRAIARVAHDSDPNNPFLLFVEDFDPEQPDLWWETYVQGAYQLKPADGYLNIQQIPETGANASVSVQRIGTNLIAMGGWSLANSPAVHQDRCAYPIDAILAGRTVSPSFPTAALGRTMTAYGRCRVADSTTRQCASGCCDDRTVATFHTRMYLHIADVNGQRVATIESHSVETTTTTDNVQASAVAGYPDGFTFKSFGIVTQNVGATGDLQVQYMNGAVVLSMNNDQWPAPPCGTHTTTTFCEWAADPFTP
jgi:hypothetical protein